MTSEPQRHEARKEMIYQISSRQTGESNDFAFFAPLWFTK